MTTLLLSAGRGTRLDGAAPGNCKALLEVGGRTMLEWWQTFDPDLTVVVRSEHVELLPPGTNFTVCDAEGGPANAVASVMRLLPDTRPVTIAYADTWLPELPPGSEWCAVAAALGGRRWYVVEDGLLSYVEIPLREAALVAVGAFRFASVSYFIDAVEAALTVNELMDGPDEVGMDAVVNAYGGLPFVPAFGWQDVGDSVGIAKWRPVG